MAKLRRPGERRPGEKIPERLDERASSSRTERTFQERVGSLIDIVKSRRDPQIKARAIALLGRLFPRLPPDARDRVRIFITDAHRIQNPHILRQIANAFLPYLETRTGSAHRDGLSYDPNDIRQVLVNFAVESYDSLNESQQREFVGRVLDIIENSNDNFILREHAIFHIGRLFPRLFEEDRNRVLRFIYTAYRTQPQIILRTIAEAFFPYLIQRPEEEILNPFDVRIIFANAFMRSFDSLDENQRSNFMRWAIDTISDPQENPHLIHTILINGWRLPFRLTAEDRQRLENLANDSNYPFQRMLQIMLSQNNH